MGKSEPVELTYEILGEAGFKLEKSLVSDPTLSQLRDEAARIAKTGRAGVRNALEISELVRAQSERLFGLNVKASASILRCIIFDKTPDANWGVGWHQDLNIKIDEGIVPWHRLASVLTLRLHLDPTPETNGALKVKPGTQLFGPLTDAERADINISEQVLPCQAGDAILMSPLLLHSSAPSEKPGHRRVIHVDYLLD